VVVNILELFARIGLKADQQPADNFAKAVKGIKGELIGAIAGTLSLAGAVKAVNEAMGDATELKKFGDQTGANVEEMQRWRSVADQVSGSGQAVASSIDAIVSNQAKIKLGTGNISGYQLLGIDPRQDPFKVLQQIRDKTANLSAADRKNITGMFGVNADLISTLKLTNAQFDAMASHAYVISPSMIDGMNRARGDITALKNEISYYVAEMATKLAPTIEKVTGFLDKFVRFIANGVINIDKLIRSTIGLKAAIIAVATVLAVMNAGFLTSPIGLFTIAILALMAVLDDLAAYNSGRGSLFGVLMLKFPGLMKVIKPLSDAFRDIGDAIRALFNGDWKKFDDITAKWGFWGGLIQEVKNGLADVADILNALMTGNWKGFMDKINKRYGYTEENQNKTDEIVKGLMSGKISFWDELKKEWKEDVLHQKPSGSNSTVYSPTINVSTDAKTGHELNLELARTEQKAYRDWQAQQSGKRNK